MISSVVIAERGEEDSPFPLTGNIMENIQKASGYGFQGVELQIENPGDYKGILKKNLDNTHMTVTSIATGLSCREGMSMSSANAAIRRKTRDRLKEYVDLASELDTGIIIHIGLIRGKREDGQDVGQYLGYFEEGLSELAEYALKYREVIAVEPLGHRDGNMLNTWEETVNVLERIPFPNLGVSLDLYHMRMEEADMMETLRQYGKWTRIVQLMDENRCYPGSGMFRFKPFLAWLQEYGYDGPIVMECIPRPDGETAVKQWLKFYHQYWGG
ncbi:sugar phosphate isomerase/epimerase [Enterocloster aldenensis]|uniref:sugar phosphate isomerase/epimerase family protein n=1 Tax=Enterocloster aldenensis TaxID=358742 RepID=UPI000E4B49BA|nr:sugar phosphate isomerase/epimerase [Enterocloster aldenensis]